MSSSPKKREVRFNSTGWLLGFLGAIVASKKVKGKRKIRNQILSGNED